jgi:hypothetical protein
MDCDIVIEITPFFGFLSLFLFLFRKSFSFRIKVFLLNLVALNSEIKGFCGCAKSLADSKRVTHAKKSKIRILMIKML